MDKKEALKQINAGKDEEYIHDIKNVAKNFFNGIKK